MLPPGLATPREVTLYYDSVYNSLIESGKAHAFLYPWAGLGAFLVIGYLLFDHRNKQILRWLRFPIAGLLSAFQVWCILTNKAKHPAAAFGVGLLSAWGIFWVSTLLVVSDCQTDCVRIERREADKETERSNGDLANGHAAVKPKAISSLFWQAYPTSMAERVDWIADAFCSFRGVGWNWQTSTVPPLPRPAMLQVPDDIKHVEYKAVTISRQGIRRFRERRDLLYNTWTNLVIGYVALDVIKCFMHRDPYFWGYTDATAPEYLPTFVQDSATMTQSLRLLISLAGIYTALWTIFRLGPAFFCGILGPKWVGLRGEAWMNPADMFGSFDNILDQGLAGWWGGWWHQVFRKAFEAHSKYLLKTLEIDPRSIPGRMLSLVVAFVMSGCLHASGSYTQLGDTRPLLGPMRFFLLQILGIAGQMQTVQLLQKAGVLNNVPGSVKRLGNFVFVHAWLYYTAPLLMDDFAKGGVWLFEPVAFSPLRAMGFGAPDDGFFCWWNGIIFWRTGRSWWDTGIAV